MHLLQNPGHAEGSIYLDTIPKRLGSALPKELIIIRIRLRSLQLPAMASDLFMLAFTCSISAMYWSNIVTSTFPLHVGLPFFVFRIKTTESILEEQRLRLSRSSWIDILTSVNLILQLTSTMFTMLSFPRTAACTFGLTVFVCAQNFRSTDAALAIRIKTVLKRKAGLLLIAMYSIAYIVASRVKVPVDLYLKKYASDNHESLAQCVNLIQGRDFTLVDSLKLGLEAFTQVSWNWWPLSPTFQRRATGRSRIQWHCVSQPFFPQFAFPYSYSSVGERPPTLVTVTDTRGN